MPFARKYILFLLFVVPGYSGKTQTKKLGVLFDRLHHSATKTERLDNILSVCDEYQSLNRDTLYNLALEARDLAAQQTDIEKQALAAMALADAYMQWGWSDSALAVFESYTVNGKGYAPASYFKMQRHHAMIYAGHADYEKALPILYAALSGAEKWKDTINQAAIMNSIGSVSLAMEKTGDALGWIHKAAALCTGNLRAQPVLAAVYTNAANVFVRQGNTDSATYYIERALPLAREAENLFVLATVLRIRATTLTAQKQFPAAEAALKEMLETRQLTGGEGLFIEDNLKLADFYAQSGQADKAIALCRKLLGIDPVKNENIPTAKDPKIRLEYWQALAAYYKLDKRLNDYQFALEKVIVLKDSLYEANSTQAIADAEIKYQSEKKQNTILQQKYSLQRSRILLYGSLALLAMLLVIAFFILRDLRRRQRLKLELAMAGEKIKAEAAVKNAEEKERLRIAADLHDNIGAYASAIRSDVDKISQGSVHDAVEHLNNLQHHSQEIMNSLRDTIWALNKENITITGISDRIKNYISKLQPSYSQVQFNIEENATNDRRINSQAALNIFRIVQEAVHNALKHSQARNIDVVIYSGVHAYISVADDGIGLNGHAQQGSGNGIMNMQARAAESGLELVFRTAEQQGTVVDIQIPTTN